ncbi:hypothetical protein [uncultured Nonlabens sp.]|uniref:hypothetical protein n=1 Tax=uncultured Nonlabens sp. TaxID=859306 RepID=UPI00262AFAC0|nr:hypothetical protein [uncultured Nonlabens sp.]
MKLRYLSIALLSFNFLLFSCQDSKKEDLIDIKIVKKDGKLVFQYLPNLTFNNAVDSAATLFDNKDFYRIMSSEIKVAPPIYQNEAFKVRVFNRSYFSENSYRYGFLVRTYTKNGKIKDEMVIASTLNGLQCEGKVTADLRIITTCPGGEETIAQIETDGTIKTLKDE